MRLLQLGNRGELSFTKEFHDDIPPYAILSHTWGDDQEEVTFHDIETASGTSKAGYAKLLFCGRQAKADGLDYFWVDTCCINKTNHTELREAITSMFRWYQNAQHCYVYLTDVSIIKASRDQPQIWEPAFRNSRWFTRGWTLQELIAPGSVKFFSQEQEFLGDKKTLGLQIQVITGVPASALSGTPMTQFSIEERLRWAEKRNTKRKEDKAYCLMGIFEVYMPLIYGEGDYAFVRLTEEIDKRSGKKDVSGTVDKNAHWIVTHKLNPLFTGRGDLLQELKDIVCDATERPSNQTQCRIVISGIAGQGKSETCVQLARSLRRMFWAVLWVDVSTTGTAERSFLFIAEKLHIPAQTLEDARLGIANLKNSWLLVLDNADDPTVDYKHYFPDGKLGVVLMTSRNPECQQYATVKSIPLGGLSSENAEELLLKAARVHKDQYSVHTRDAAVVANLLRSHPLALTQAGAYVSRGHCTLSQYPRVFQQHRERLLTFHSVQGRSRYGDVYATFEASAEFLQSSQAGAETDALQLLRVLATCGTNRLPLALFEAGWEGARSVSTSIADDDTAKLTTWHISRLLPLLELDNDEWDSFRLAEAIHILETLSLVSTDRIDGVPSVSMHPLIHAWARDRQNMTEQHNSWIATGCLFAVLDTRSEFWLQNRWQLQPHLQALMVWDINKMFASEPTRKVTTIIVKCGWLLEEMRNDSKLFDLMGKLTEHLGLDPCTVYRNWVDVYELTAANFYSMSRFKEAVLLQEQLVKITEQLAEDDPDRLKVQHQLARAYLENGQVKEAIALLELVLKTGEILAENHPSRLASESELAKAYRKNGQAKEAVAMLEHVVMIQEQLAEDHPSRLISDNELARAYRENGQIEEAIALLEHVVRIWEQVLAEDHPHRLVSQYELARAYRENGQIEEAIALLEHVVRIQEQVLAEDHPSRLISQHELARAYRENGQIEEAIALLEHVVRIQEQVLAEDHPSRLISQHELARAYRENGQIEEAIALLEHVVRIQEQVLAEDHPERLSSEHDLATAYWDFGRRNVALQMMRHTVEIQRDVLDEYYPNRIASEAWLKDMEWEMNEENGKENGKEKGKGKRNRGELFSTGAFPSDGRFVASRSINDHIVPPLDLRVGDSIAEKHEAGGNEDSDSLSDLSEASSAQSLPSLMSDSSSTSIRDEYASQATEHLAALLLGDPVLTSMYDAAIAKFGRERFQKNHDQLLKAYFKDLRLETQNYVQRATVRGLRNPDRRHEITLLIQAAHERKLNIPREQELDRKQLLDNYLREMASRLQIDSLTSWGNELEPKMSILGKELDQDDELADEASSSSSSDDGNDRPLDPDYKETYAYLEPLETFITKGDAFARFKTSFGCLLKPPTSLSEALKSHDLRVVQRFLARNFVSVAKSDYAWLHELDEAGYSTREMAELLLEDVSDSPWIYFTPRVHIRHPVRTVFHVPGCAHQASFNTRPQSLLFLEQFHPCSPLLHTDIRKLVEELCGIGGVVPASRDVSTWHGSVTFEKQSSVSVITYAHGSTVVQQSRNDLMVRISNVLGNFCAAAAAVQSYGLCCDSFTVLLRIKNCLEVRRIEFSQALMMASDIRLAFQDNDKGKIALQRCAETAENILRELKVTVPEKVPDADLHYCALAAQFLCSAFLSYVQAHVGPVDPFFLDKPQRRIVLLGSQQVSGDFAINAELFELTCLAEMTQQLVFAFYTGTETQESRLERGTSRFDVLTNAEDLLDTWGPGYFIHNRADPGKLHGIAIGGGFVFTVNGKTSRFHWARGKFPPNASQAFEPNTIMRIGTAVSINDKCYIDEAMCRESSFYALEPLGTHEVFWEPQERQAGLQGGQYFTGYYSQTWKKTPGTTLKQRSLQQSDWRLVYFLDQSWGLQVSFCTSVARRVSLRELITDLFPIFVNPLEQKTWQELVTRHKIIQAFTQGNIFAWLRTLSPFLQLYVLTLVRTILEQLQHTGIDRRNATLVIAWPREGDIERGLKIPCKAETCWAQIIADAEDCATFAYVTTRCLETKSVKCRGSLRAWQNASKVLVTEMSPSGLEGQPVVVINAAVSNPPAAPLTTMATAMARWELEDQKTYYIKKLDSLLRVKVERPPSASNDVTHLVVETSTIPQGLWKRLLLRGENRKNYQIRERQAIGDRAELVVVRSGLIGV